MSIQKYNLETVSDLLPITRRDFPLADPALAQALNAVALLDGEWVTFDTANKLVRATNIASVGNAATVRSFPVWAERGRYDVQAIAGTKVPILYLGSYECDTRVFDAAAVVGSGLAITTLLQPLKVATITLGARNYTGLVGSQASDTAPVVGYVTRLPSANGGKLRFISGF
jgi:hypothetical protein